jgi:hypothetical protein
MTIAFFITSRLKGPELSPPRAEAVRAGETPIASTAEMISSPGSGACAAHTRLDTIANTGISPANIDDFIFQLSGLNRLVTKIPGCS